IGNVQAETLPRHRVAVLHPGIAHRVLGNAGPACQLLCHPCGVGPGFLYPQQQVLTFTAGLEAEVLVDLEILRGGAHHRGQHRWRAARPGHAHAGSRCISTTAWAAMTSPRPVKPNRSLVVALTLTAPTPMSRSAAMCSRMRSSCGASRGASQTTTLSTLPTQ